MKAASIVIGEDLNECHMSLSNARASMDVSLRWAVVSVISRFPDGRAQTRIDGGIE
jgi:hypothetical protein